MGRRVIGHAVLPFTLRVAVRAQVFVNSRVSVWPGKAGKKVRP